MICTTVLYLLLSSFDSGQSTDITVSTTIIDKSLGRDVGLPVLMCHPRHTNYTEVTWGKDNTILQSMRTSDSRSHYLSLADLLNETSHSALEFDNPLKLQGYYWCQTDQIANLIISIHGYFFRIKEIDTFVGKFVATKDTLGERENLSQEVKIAWKKKLYEQEMETTLFGFLQAPSVYVTNIKVLPAGLAVNFFLYVRTVFDPRKPVDNKLMHDQDQLLYVQEYLRNETETVDPIIYYKVENWTDLVGIDINQIKLRSTLGCYEEHHLMESNPASKVIWPYARIGDVVIPDNACSSKNGLSVTRMCTGSFYQGAKWGNPSGECEKSAEGVTLQLKNIYEEFGNVKKSETIQKLVEVTRYPSVLSIADLHLAIEILKEISRKPKLDHQEMSGILSVIDKILETNKTELVAAKTTIRLTTRILRIFDNLLQQATDEEKEIQISKHHLMFDTKYTKTHDKRNPILGLAVIAPKLTETLHNGSIQFVTSNTKLPQHESLGYFSLPRDLVLKRESDIEVSKHPCQVNMIYFKQWDLFQDPRSILVKRNYKVLPSPVVYVSISGGPAWNLTDPVHLYFKDTLDAEVEDPVCVYYDPLVEDGTGGWTTEGCEYEGYKNGYYHCQCHHLSIFAVILSVSPDTIASPRELKLGTSIYVACGVSMLALSLAVILYILSKIWRQTIDHSILFSQSLCFLVCIIIIFVSETHFARRPGCVVLALVLHYTIFTIFGWLLVQAIIYRLRFAKRTDVGEIPHFMIKTGLVIWGVPVIIVIIMWFSREYPCCTTDNCWYTVAEVSKEAVVPLGVLILIILCVYACATYSLTCHFKKDFLINDTQYNDVVVKFRVAFTIFVFFVLTWLFGFFALHRSSKSIRILFSIGITLTAYYLSLFFVFQEVSLWELCYRCKKNKVESEDGPAMQYQAASYKSVDDSSKERKQ